jgi:alkylation response protein AidB-like acyl-CoA dehydrogenase
MAERLVGDLNNFQNLPSGVARGTVGVMLAASESAQAYATSREQFGKPIG